MAGTGFMGRGAAVAMVGVALAGTVSVEAAVAAAPQPYACYYNPTAPCYKATGVGGFVQDINPVDYVAGVGGNGSIAFASNDNGGTVSALSRGSYLDASGYPQGWSAQASLKHYINVDYVSGPLDALVPLRIVAYAAHTSFGTIGGGQAQYYAEQQGQRLAGARAFADKFAPEVLFSINQIVYVKPDVPIEIRMKADSTGDHSVMVDPVYGIVGDFASRYRLSGLLSSTPAQAVPEPASWAMMILGFSAVGMASRRRRGAAARVRAV